METKIILETQDLTYLKWSHVRNSSGTAGTFSFNASCYTAEELTRKAHNFELEESGHTVLCIDYRQNGIGSNSCGPRAQKKYTLSEETFTFDINLAL